MNLKGAMAFLCMGLLAIEGCKEDEPVEIPFVKEVYIYKSVMIVTQEWMAEYLKKQQFL